ncbi:hypothetical protein LXL04_037121 [Taraxacum kok-saghyz]
MKCTRSDFLPPRSDLPTDTPIHLLFHRLRSLSLVASGFFGPRLLHFQSSSVSPCAIVVSFSLSSLTLCFCIPKLCAPAISASSTGKLQDLKNMISRSLIDYYTSDQSTEFSRSSNRNIGTHLSLLSLSLGLVLSTRLLTKIVIDPTINFKPKCCLD